MSGLTHSAFRRLFRDGTLWAFLGFMLVCTAALLLVEYATAEVLQSASRMVFEPLLFLPLAAAAFTAVFAGTEFSDDAIHGRVLYARSRSRVLLSELFVCCAGCLIVYVLSEGLAFFCSVTLYENDLNPEVFAGFLLLGGLVCVSCTVLFTVVTFLCADRTKALLLCVGLAIVALLSALSIQQNLLESAGSPGVPNPYGLSESERGFLCLMQDLNFSGQAVQLWDAEVVDPLQSVLCSVGFIVLFTAAGCLLFEKRELQ